MSSRRSKHETILRLWCPCAISCDGTWPGQTERKLTTFLQANAGRWSCSTVSFFAVSQEIVQDTKGERTDKAESRKTVLRCRTRCKRFKKKDTLTSLGRCSRQVHLRNGRNGTIITVMTMMTTPLLPCWLPSLLLVGRICGRFASGRGIVLLMMSRMTTCRALLRFSCFRGGQSSVLPTTSQPASTSRSIDCINQLNQETSPSDPRERRSERVECH